MRPLCFQVPPLASLSSVFAELPMELEDDVQNGTMVAWERSALSTNVSMMRGASPHQMGYPR